MQGNKSFVFQCHFTHFKSHLNPETRPIRCCGGLQQLQLLLGMFSARLPHAPLACSFIKVFQRAQAWQTCLRCPIRNPNYAAKFLLSPYLCFLYLFTDYNSSRKLLIQRVVNSKCYLCCTKVACYLHSTISDTQDIQSKCRIRNSV